MTSVLGTILDPAADKALMTTLTVTLALKGLLPGQYYFLFSSFQLVASSSISSFQYHWQSSYLEETCF